MRHRFVFLGWAIAAVFAVAVLIGGSPWSAHGAEIPARQLFGHKAKAAALQAGAIGSYAKGCLAGGAMLPVNGPAWQAMRLSRNRNWGHPRLVTLVQRLARESQELDGWPGLLVGDLAQPRGGPMLTGHRSHQIGLDADIWLMPMPKRTLSRAEREKISAISMIKNPFSINEKHWKPGHVTLIRRAASYPEVARIFIHPAIKQALCKSDQAGSWLRKVRPWWGHHYHFHIRLKCPMGSPGCANQDPPPSGTGCGKPLEDWFARFRKPKPKKPVKPKPRRQLRMADLPQACRAVLAAADADTGVVLTAAPAERSAVKPAAMPPPMPKPQTAHSASPPPVPAKKPPVKASVGAPLPSAKPKPVARGARRVAPARTNPAPNLPWLNGLATPGPPLPTPKPR
ncbi:MAG: penicillin-insensitive murein endopeptidase [Hyphomicrobiales bacterium]|nr:penicillin-insensitive murein endopeptidase [Hyphomicrobiales bacterium]